MDHPNKKKPQNRTGAASWRLCVVESEGFQLGQLFITRNAQATLDYSSVLDALMRHGCGDWGDICEEDRGLNEDALRTGGRLLSVYHDLHGTKFWIITEADRSTTTVLLPEDY